MTEEVEKGKRTGFRGYRAMEEGDGKCVCRPETQESEEEKGCVRKKKSIFSFSTSKPNPMFQRAVPMGCRSLARKIICIGNMAFLA